MTGNIHPTQVPLQSQEREGICKAACQVDSTAGGGDCGTKFIYEMRLSKEL
jgi:hypothetical protein